MYNNIAYDDYLPGHQYDDILDKRAKPDGVYEYIIGQCAKQKESCLAFLNEDFGSRVKVNDYGDNYQLVSGGRPVTLLAFGEIAGHSAGTRLGASGNHILPLQGSGKLRPITDETKVRHVIVLGQPSGATGDLEALFQNQIAAVGEFRETDARLEREKGPVPFAVKDWICKLGGDDEYNGLILTGGDLYGSKQAFSQKKAVEEGASEARTFKRRKLGTAFQTTTPKTPSISAGTAAKEAPPPKATVSQVIVRAGDYVDPTDVSDYQKNGPVFRHVLMKMIQMPYYGRKRVIIRMSEIARVLLPGTLVFAWVGIMVYVIVKKEFGNRPRKVYHLAIRQLHVVGESHLQALDFVPWTTPEEDDERINDLAAKLDPLPTDELESPADSGPPSSPISFTGGTPLTVASLTATSSGSSSFEPARDSSVDDHGSESDQDLSREYNAPGSDEYDADDYRMHDPIPPFEPGGSDDSDEQYVFTEDVHGKGKGYLPSIKGQSKRGSSGSRYPSRSASKKVVKRAPPRLYFDLSHVVVLLILGKVAILNRLQKSCDLFDLILTPFLVLAWIYELLVDNKGREIESRRWSDLDNKLNNTVALGVATCATTFELGFHPRMGMLRELTVTPSTRTGQQRSELILETMGDGMDRMKDGEWQTVNGLVPSEDAQLVHPVLQIGRHCIHNNIFFTSIGKAGSRLPDVIPVESTLHPSAQWSRLPRFDRPHWISGELPFLPFVPNWNIFTSTLLSCLNETYSSVPIEQAEDGKYVLRQDVLQKWDFQERMHRLLLNVAMGLAHVPLSAVFRLWSWPRQYGYQFSHQTESACRRQVLAARNAFVPLVAAIIFFVRYAQMVLDEDVLPDPCSPLPAGSDGLTTRPPLWRLRLSACPDVDCVWLNEWITTFLPPIGSVYCEYVGGYLDFAKSMKDHNSSYVPLYEFSCVPVFIRWGPSSTFLSPLPHTVQQVLPTRAELSALTVAYSTRNHVSGEVDNLSRNGNAGDEAVRMFFERRAQRDLVLIQNETEKERQQRINRQSAASAYNTPSSRGARVYIWERVGDRFVRTLVARREVIDFWDDYTPNQKRFDAIRNEWDLWHGFAPNEAASYSDDDDFDDFDRPDMEMPSPSFTYREEGELSPLHVFENDIHTHDTPLPDAAEVMPHLYSSSFNAGQVLSADTILDVAYKRYIFCPVFQGSVSFHTLPWQRVQKVLGCSGSKVGIEDEERISRIVEAVVSNGSRLISWESPMFNLIVERQKLVSTCPFKISLLSGDTTVYLLRFPLPQEAFTVAVFSPTTILEVLKRGVHADNQTLITFLVARCVPFRTLVEGPLRELPSAPSSQYTVHGYRAPEYTFTVHDYYAYTERVQAFFRLPKSRAALLYGGIVARLAHAFLKPEDIVDGPSESVMMCEDGACFSDGAQSLYGYWDDHLTDDDIDLICGVYNVGTGQYDRQNHPQVAHRSWWPRPQSWKYSGLNDGYWSNDAEAWFMKRYSAIRDGRARPFTHTEWKDQIKFTKTTLTFVDEEVWRVVFKFTAQSPPTDPTMVSTLFVLSMVSYIFRVIVRNDSSLWKFLFINPQTMACVPRLRTCLSLSKNEHIHVAFETSPDVNHGALRHATSFLLQHSNHVQGLEFRLRSQVPQGIFSPPLAPFPVLDSFHLDHDGCLSRKLATPYLLHLLRTCPLNELGFHGRDTALSRALYVMPSILNNPRFRFEHIRVISLQLVVSDQWMVALTHLTQLRSLHVTYAIASLRYAASELVVHLPHLTNLSIAGEAVALKRLLILLDAPNLECLTVDGMTNTDFEAYMLGVRPNLVDLHAKLVVADDSRSLALLSSIAVAGSTLRTLSLRFTGGLCGEYPSIARPVLFPVLQTIDLESFHCPSLVDDMLRSLCAPAAATFVVVSPKSHLSTLANATMHTQVSYIRAKIQIDGSFVVGSFLRERPTLRHEFFIIDLSVKDMLRLYRVSKETYHDLHAFFTRAYRLERVLSPFFSAEEIPQFRFQLWNCSALVSGSTALSFFNRENYGTNDLDVYSDVDSLDDLVAWLLFIGFVFHPRVTARNSQRRDLFEAIEYARTVLVNNVSYHLKRIHLDGVDYFCSGIVDVFDFIRDGKKVQIIACASHPLGVILQFHSTIVMNFIGAYHAVSLYPKSTFVDGKGLRMNCQNAERAWEKYSERGWTLVSSVPLDTEFSLDSELSVLDRVVGDKFSWVIPLEECSLLPSAPDNVLLNSFALSYEGIQPRVLTSYMKLPSSTPGTLCVSKGFAFALRSAVRYGFVSLDPLRELDTLDDYERACWHEVIARALSRHSIITPSFVSAYKALQQSLDVYLSVKHCVTSAQLYVLVKFVVNRALPAPLPFEVILRSFRPKLTSPGKLILLKHWAGLSMTLYVQHWPDAWKTPV
ncbi:hypothetical protein VNI00_015655 [Paramarasmius palmivorus]|uniref:Uncharacterized protein n=1 Tax=Paramarasmius palmivorus TaxID=297713 RepID=A0AAW0BL13_9AGAR